VSIAYKPLHDVLAVAVEEKTLDGARRLIQAAAFESAALMLDALQSSGAIGEQMASTLAMELNDQMVKAQKKPSDSRETTREEATPKPAARKGQRKKAIDAAVVQFCPICLEEGVQTELSAGSSGCVKHWREVKRRAKAAG